MEPLVEIKNLSIRFPEGNSTFEAVKGISFSIGKGEIVGVVGESGSGKSMSALALMGLLPKDAEIASGSLCFQGEDLVTMKPEKRRQLCGSKMARCIMCMVKTWINIKKILPTLNTIVS